jgi:hypothetical protein
MFLVSTWLTLHAYVQTGIFTSLKIGMGHGKLIFKPLLQQQEIPLGWALLQKLSLSMQGLTGSAHLSPSWKRGIESGEWRTRSPYGEANALGGINFHMVCI